MTNEELKRANSLKRKIDELSSFIYLASRDGFWEEIVFRKELRMFTNVIPYKNEDKKGYELEKDLTLR